MKLGLGIRLRVCRLRSERLPLVIDRFGVPISAPNQWSLTTRRPRVQSNTLIEEMRTVAHVYDWAERRAINLQQRFQAGNGLQPNELNALFQNLLYMRPLGRELANRRLQDVSELRAVSNSTHGARVAIARDYLVWSLKRAEVLSGKGNAANWIRGHETVLKHARAALAIDDDVEIAEGQLRHVNPGGPIIGKPL